MTTWLQKLGWKNTDFKGLMDAQLTLAARALERLEQWCKAPSQELVDEIFQLEKEADRARLGLAIAVSTAFETPVDREDLSDLSRRIDDLVDSTRATVRLGAALKVVPHKNITEMIANMVDGCKELHASIMALPKQLDEANLHARKARRPQRLNERLYCTGIAEVYEQATDLQATFRQMELYHAVIRLSEVQEDIADLLDHAINKLT